MTHMTRPVWVDMSGATRRKCLDLVQRCAFLSHDQSQHRCLADLSGVVEHGTHLNLDGGFKYLLCSPLFGENFQFDYYFSDGLKAPTSNTFFFHRWLRIRSFSQKSMRKTIAVEISQETQLFTQINQIIWLSYMRTLTLRRL